MPRAEASKLEELLSSALPVAYVHFLKLGCELYTCPGKWGTAGMLSFAAAFLGARENQNECRIVSAVHFLSGKTFGAMWLLHHLLFKLKVETSSSNYSLGNYLMGFSGGFI